MRRLALVGGLSAAALSLAWHLLHGHNMFYAAWVAGCVMFAVGAILNVAMAMIQKVLIGHLEARREALRDQQQTAGEAASK